MNAIGNDGEAAENSIDNRTRRACVESMTVVPLGSGEFEIYSGETSVYTWSLGGRCSCPDEERRAPEGGCKHARRCMMMLGLLEVPDLGRKTDVEAMIEARKRVSERRAARAAPVAMADGGVVVESGEAEADEADEADEDESACICEIGDDLPCAECYIERGVRGEVTEVRR